MLALGTLAALLLSATLPAAETPTTTNASDASGLGAVWTDAAHLSGPIAARSRGLLLGARDPNGPSCVQTLDGAALFSAADGGVGTRMCYLLGHAAGERSNPRAEYTWQQSTLRAACERLKRENHMAYAKALRLADLAARLTDGLAEASALPPDLQPLEVNDGGTLLGCTLRRLDEAVARRDLAQARIWAREFRAAADRLADLHRWVHLIVENQLASLAFQKQCRSLYMSVDRPFDMAGMVADQSTPCFPALQNAPCMVYNLMETEHQAEWLFARPPQAWRPADETPTSTAPHRLPAVASAVGMPPHLREAFAVLRSRLEPDTQPLWDEAAAAPYHRTYLANVIHRYRAVGVLDEVGTVLERFDRIQDEPTVNALMDVLFYRGGTPNANASPADRFDPRLMQASRTLAGTREQVLLGAQHFTRAWFGSWENYEGGSDSLSQALDAGKLDCIDASNMVGTLYRNAGRGGYYAVRWCAGVVGHSVSGALLDCDGQPTIGIVDGLDQPQTAVDLWPHAYSKGNEWPKGYVGLRAPVYAVEILGRGLDNYMWCQGFIVRGAHAGTLVRSTIPYLPAWTPTAFAHRRSSPARASTPVRTP
jgi:hypothetical protein